VTIDCPACGMECKLQNKDYSYITMELVKCKCGERFHVISGEMTLHLDGKCRGVLDN